MSEKERIIAYIDGFNLYFGMKDAGFDNLIWLNIRKLIRNVLRENQVLQEVKYFTSRVRNNPDKEKRQNTYIEALETTGVQVIYGHYQTNLVKCNRCGHNWNSDNEKMTDVNIATHMLVDAFQDRIDTAVLVSGDSDLVPPIEEIHRIFHGKRVFVLFPPKRHNVTVKNAARGSMVIGRKKLKDCQFHSEIVKADGFTLKKPTAWY
jgi:uncharacterized LabA/DUF88 family protein